MSDREHTVIYGAENDGPKEQKFTRRADAEAYAEGVQGIIKEDVTETVTETVTSEDAPEEPKTFLTEPTPRTDNDPFKGDTLGA